MSNKLTEYRNKCLTQLEKHVAIERQWFQHLLQHQEKVMQLQTQNWYQSWKIGWLEKKVRSLGFKDKLYQELEKIGYGKKDMGFVYEYLMRNRNMEGYKK